MAPAALLRMHDKGIRHHFRGNPRNVYPHYCGITAYLLSSQQTSTGYRHITVFSITIHVFTINMDTDE